MRVFINSLFLLFSAAYKKFYVFLSTIDISFILASAALVTSLTTLLIVPNSLFKWWTHRHWQENIKIIRLNTNDYTYVYNGNYDSVFFDRVEVKSNEIGKMKYIEIGKAIEGNSYLVFTHKGIAFKGMYQGSVASLLANGTLQEKYEMVTINVDNPLLNSLGVGKPTLYTAEAKLFFNFGLESKEVLVKANSFLVMKIEDGKESLNAIVQPRVECNFTPNFDPKTGKKIE